MVLPNKVRRAAKRGQVDIVAAWLESGGGVNDVDGDGKERTLLIWTTCGRGSRGIIAESHVALARLLLARGADVNHSDQHGYTPLHYAAHGRNYGRARESSHSESGPEVPLAALLLNAGANVLALNYRNHNPLSLVYQRMRQAGPSRSGMEMSLLLMRALPSLDCAWRNPVTGTIHSSELLLDEQENRADPPLPPGNCFDALRVVVAGVRAAGGWRAYDRRPRAAVLRLRSLALRRRAVLPRATRHNGPNMRSLEFLVRCPPEIAWHILGYWRCQYTPFIYQLGH